MVIHIFISLYIVVLYVYDWFINAMCFYLFVRVWATLCDAQGFFPDFCSEFTPKVAQETLFGTSICLMQAMHLNAFWSGRSYFEIN